MGLTKILNARTTNVYAARNCEWDSVRIFKEQFSSIIYSSNE